MLEHDRPFCLSVCHTRDPRRNVQDIEIHFTPYDRAILLVFLM